MKCHASTWKSRVLAACQQLLPEVYLGAFRSRVAEVLESGVPVAPDATAVRPDDIVGEFHRCGLLSGPLIECCDELRHEQLPSAERLAVCFAACWHPQLSGALSRGALLSARVSAFLQALDMERLENVFRLVLPSPVPLLFSRQVARVLVWIVPDAARHLILDRPTLLAAFRRKALIPPALVRPFAAHESRVGMDAELLAVIFAACAFPERAFQMDRAVELPDRVATFLEALAFLRGFGDDRPPPLEVARRLLSHTGVLPDSIEANSFNQLLADLSAAEAVADGWLGQVSTVDRLAGAALFLATSTATRLRELLQNWERERGFLCSLRQQIITTPLAWLRDPPAVDRRPGWPEVKSTAAQALAGVPEQHLDSAIVLTQMAWKKAAELQLPMPFDSVRDFWDHQMTRLCSGFPYFAFLSRFTYWWKQCLHTYSFYRPAEALPEDDALPGVGGPDESPDEEISVPLLRSLREGYRLVRTTFFRRADSMKSGANHEAEAVPHNELIRRALDAIWYERLSCLDEDDAGVERVKHIAERFPELGLDTITNLTHRLPIRVQAYTLARCRRLSNTEIASCRKSSLDPAGRLRVEFPFRGEKGFLPITSLARGLPLECSLLWAFAAFVFLFPKVVPQRPDPWSPERFLRELWFWLQDADPSTVSIESLPWGDLGLSAARAADTLRSDPAIGDLLLDLMTCSTPDEAARWQPGGGPAALEMIARRIQKLFPVAAAARVFTRRGVAELRRACRQSNHWIIPVYFYALVADKPVYSLPLLLVVEPDEVPKVTALHRAMQALADQPQATDEAQP